MNTKEVYINGVMLDLNEKDNPIQLTYAVNDLAELKDRQAYSTNTFKIPYTANNAEACGFPNDPNFIQLQPYRKNDAKVIQGGIEVLTNGIALIKSSSGSIEVQILSGLIGFFDSMGDKNIRDLDLSAFDHNWDLVNVVLSQTNTEGYIYPVIDYGSISDIDRKADIRLLRPATFRKTVIEAIIREGGYTAIGNYQNYPKYLNSIIPFANDKFEHGKSFIDQENTFSMSARSVERQVLNQDHQVFIINFPDDAISDPGNRWNGTEYTAPVIMKATITVKYDIDVRDTFKGGSTPEIRVYIQKNDTDIANNVHSTGGDFVSTYYADQVLEISTDLNAGDKIRIRWDIAPAINRGLAIMQPGASVSVKYIPGDVVYGQQVQLAATLPNISQKNFFKDFLQNFGLTAIPDNYGKKLLLINMEDVYAQKPNAQDITDKLINTPDSNTFALTEYGINNNATYKEDDAVPTALGKGVIVLDNLTLPENVDMFESVFAASIKVNKMGGLNVTQIEKIEDKESGEFKIKTEPRILLNQTVQSRFNFYDGNNNMDSDLISLPVFDGLDYQTLFEENYPEIKRMLYHPYISIKQILLKEIDIKKITDWTIPVYDKKTASYYYKNQVNYLQGDISTISLIRLP